MLSVSKRRFQLLGIVLLVKAISHILGGLIGICGMDKTNFELFMYNVADNTIEIYSGIILQIVSCIAITILGVLLYQTTHFIHKTAALIALCFYILSATLWTISQIIAFGLLENSKLFIAVGSTLFLDIGIILLSTMDFAMNMANIPFGVGIILSFCLFIKGKALPVGLSVCGLSTMIPALIGSIIQVYSIAIPFWLMVIYTPFEFIIGGYFFIKSFSTVISQNIHSSKEYTQ